MTSIKTGIRVIGEGSVSVWPDTAKITLGTVTENTDLQTVQTQNGATISRVIQGLLNLGMKPENIKTGDYRIDPQYIYEDGKQIFQGYRVSHMLEVTTTNLNDVGRIVDTAVTNGVNSVSNVNFFVKNDSIFYQEALIHASHDAVKKAATIAHAFGISFNRIPSLIVEESIGNKPVPLHFELMKTAAQTPIKPGKLTIQARISATFGIY